MRRHVKKIQKCKVRLCLRSRASNKALRPGRVFEQLSGKRFVVILYDILS